MRTTIELSVEHRSALLRIAGERGEKGFSSIVAEAVAAYLARAKDGLDTRRRALSLRGTLTAPEAEDLESVVREIRDRWR